MRILLLVLCLLASCNASAAERSSHDESSLERSDSTAELRSIEETPVRLSRKFRGNSRTRRVHIENQHGFDGKVEKIHINSEENHPRIRAYGLQKKHQLNNGHIEKTVEKEATDGDDTTRIPRSIEAYGKSKKHLETNGDIERVQTPIPVPGHQIQRHGQARLPRSIEAKENQEQSLEDLEGQDAKVFRPLFVYRQQLAKRQHRERNQVYYLHGSRKPCYNSRTFY